MPDRPPSVDAMVIGSTGYVGGELLRLLAGHPHFRLAAAISTRSAGQPVTGLFPGLALNGIDSNFLSVDDALSRVGDLPSLALFSAAPHGHSAAVVSRFLARAEAARTKVHVVDVSADFRYRNADRYRDTYGQDHGAIELLEQFRCAVPEHLDDPASPHIGHPGCFATAMLIALVPLMRSEFVYRDVFVSGITGSTGSGRAPGAGTHHPERHSNLYPYKPLEHRHVPEVEDLIRDASGRNASVSFVPHSGPFARGILVTVHARLKAAADRESIERLYRDAYRDKPFVRLLDQPPRVKDVVGSNLCHTGVAVSGDNVVAMVAIDNLVKGAAGGAVQWMNRLWRLPETSGLTGAAPAWT